MEGNDLHFAVIGWGYWGPKIARNLDSLPHVQVTFIADMDAGRLATVAEHLPLAKTTTTIADVLWADVDGVVIATPVKTHYQLAKEALLHGKHVLVEKPLTADVAQAEELVALAKK